MTDTRQDDERLDALFAAARDRPPEPADELMARVMRQAEDVQDGFARVALPASRVRRSGLIRLVRGLGGWPAVAGLGAAALAGLWIGVSPPAGLARVTMAALGGQAYVIDADPLSMLDFTQEAL